MVDELQLVSHSTGLVLSPVRGALSNVSQNLMCLIFFVKVNELTRLTWNF